MQDQQPGNLGDCGGGSNDSSVRLNFTAPWNAIDRCKRGMTRTTAQAECGNPEIILTAETPQTSSWQQCGKARGDSVVVARGSSPEEGEKESGAYQNTDDARPADSRVKTGGKKEKERR